MRHTAYVGRAPMRAPSEEGRNHMKEITIAAILALALAPASAWACEPVPEPPTPPVLVDDEPEPVPPTPERLEDVPDVNPVSAEDFKWLGVVEYGGHCETYYSSQELYHPDTPLWTLDEDGFYRTSEGLFVVATDAYPYGEIIETSRGPAQVLDCGCGWAIDFYTNWE